MDSFIDNLFHTMAIAGICLFVFAAILFVVILHLCAFGFIPTTVSSTSFIFVSAFVDFVLFFTLVKTLSNL